MRLTGKFWCAAWKPLDTGFTDLVVRWRSHSAAFFNVLAGAVGTSSVLSHPRLTAQFHREAPKLTELETKPSV